MEYQKSIIRNQLKKLVGDKPVRMHMPGHKGKKQKYRYDVTEIIGADNLHNATGIIKKAQDKVSEVYGSEESIFLVGSTTAGLQASIMSSLKEGDKILVPVNAHRSIYPALSFSRLNPVYYKPESKNPGMTVTPELIENLLEENTDIRALIVVSPDFFGNLSDIKAIKKVTDKFGITLIIDQAHGAHLKFLECEQDAVSAGADYVVESTHKLLGAPTQGAILHMQGKANKKKARKVLSMIESSSPSYMIMSGIEDAVDEAVVSANKKFKKIYAAHDGLMNLQKDDDPMQLVTPEGNYDKSKFIFSVPNAHDVEKYMIEELRVIPEMTYNDLIVCMTGIGTSQKDINRLFGAVSIINEKLKEEGVEPVKEFENFNEILKPFNIDRPLYEVLGEVGEEIKLDNAEGRIVTNFIVPYPPGIPILIPGSIITQEDIELINNLINKKNVINGIDFTEDGEILIEVMKANET